MAHPHTSYPRRAGSRASRHCGCPFRVGLLATCAATSGCASVGESFVSVGAFLGAISGGMAFAYLGIGGGVLVTRALRRALVWYRGLQSVPRSLLRRLVILVVLAGGAELLLDALASAGMRPLVIGLAGAGLYILLLRGLVLLARDARVAVEAWSARQGQRLVTGFARVLDARGSGGQREVAPPATSPRPIEAGPTCWICGGRSDGHAH